MTYTFTFSEYRNLPWCILYLRIWIMSILTNDTYSILLFSLLDFLITFLLFLRPLYISIKHTYIFNIFYIKKVSQYLTWNTRILRNELLLNLTDSNQLAAHILNIRVTGLTYVICMCARLRRRPASQVQIKPSSTSRAPCVILCYTVRDTNLLLGSKQRKTYVTSKTWLHS